MNHWITQPYSRRSYPLALTGFLRLKDQPLPVAFTSQSIASHEMLLETEGQIECNPLAIAAIELHWPATLANGTPLKLCLWGTILQVKGNLVQFRIRKFSFRTRGTGKAAAA